MGRRGRRNKQNRKKYRIAVLIVLVVLSCTYIALAERLSPQEAILRLKAPQAGENLDPLIRKASRLEGLRPWAEVLAAREFERRGVLDSAFELVRTAKESPTAAGREAELVYLRLAAESGEPLRTKISDLHRFSIRYMRGDLEPEVLYTIGRLSEPNTTEALKYYELLRQRFPKSNFAPKARDRSRILRKGLSGREAILSETKLLIAEGETKEARELLAKAKALSTPHSPEAFDALFVEEPLLRKENQPLKADELLLQIAAEGPPEHATKALLQAAKNSWNENDQVHALELLDQLEKRFPSSSLVAESNYMEGRILEEMGQLTQAEKAYLNTGNSDPLLKVRSLKRLSWLKFLRQDYGESLKLSETCLSILSGAKDPAIASDVFYETQSALYWRARSLNELSKPEAVPAFQEVIEKDRRSFYSMLARAALRSKGVKVTTYLPPSSNPCVNTKDLDGLEGKLKDFTTDSLRDLAQHEIDFYFTLLRRDASGDTLISTLTLHSEWSRLSGLVSSEVEIAEEALKNLRLSGRESDCRSQLAYLAYPIPFEQSIALASTKNRVAVESILAISRTESYFRPDAQSPVGALGLMQLMPQTARAEGWDGKVSLTEPEINIQLGTKHLARLLGEYKGNLGKAAAAYNAGGAAVNRWLSRFGNYPDELFIEFIGYPETNKYVRRVLTSAAVYSELLRKDVPDHATDKLQNLSSG